MKKLIGILGLAAACTIIAASAFVGSASAHAELDTSVPAADSTVATSPATVALTFVEEIQHTAGSYALDVTNSSLVSVTSGTPTIGSDSMSLSIALKPNLPNGKYTVTWSNLSVDGDALTDETFSFTVGSDVTPPNPAPGAVPTPHTHDHAEEMEAPSGPFDSATVGSITVPVMAEDGSGVEGRAELIPVEGGAMTEVGLYLSGIAAGSSHLAHIHVASTCFEGAHAADLDNVEATDSGYGRSVTTVDLPFSAVADGKHNILVHAGANASSAADQHVVACAIIPAQPAGAHPIGLPNTGAAGGESNRSATFVSIALLLLAGTMITAGGLKAARRNG